MVIKHKPPPCGMLEERESLEEVLWEGVEVALWARGYSDYEIEVDLPGRNVRIVVWEPWYAFEWLKPDKSTHLRMVMMGVVLSIRGMPEPGEVLWDVQKKTRWPWMEEPTQKVS